MSGYSLCKEIKNLKGGGERERNKRRGRELQKLGEMEETGDLRVYYREIMVNFLMHWPVTYIR